ncbi:hypothetical protein [Virgibacillus salexigens]|uniref:Uncharacterized protein n=1 Tax=Virgibacillus massiliensis TaxID=1462526 RepID=A0A024QI30_9BACI|nr:hypothetical protein [Virgibacillus massiliensis]CDQ41850.1 hypothetical protein BN990_04229 [Virgibacillus massiliensis]
MNYNMPTGRYVELYVKEIFKELFETTYVEATKEDDLYRGTDFFIGSVPIDVTINESKDHCKLIKKYLLDGVTVSVSKRNRNARVTFERPVLVFHFDLYDLRDRMQICELIDESLTQDIITEILGLYK